MILPMKEVIYGLREHYKNADKAERVIIENAAVAAGANVIGSWIPVLAIPAAITACIGAVWVLYGRLCSTLGISLKGNLMKLLARAAVANIGANLTGALIAILIPMFIPGASAAASAVLGFCVVYIAGQIFLNFVLKMAKKSSNPYSFDDISEREMQDTVRNNSVSTDDLKQARESFSKR